MHRNMTWLEAARHEVRVWRVLALTELFFIVLMVACKAAEVAGGVRW